MSTGAIDMKTIVRNLRTLNRLPPRPIRSWVKKTGCPDSRTIASAIKAMKETGGAVVLWVLLPPDRRLGEFPPRVRLRGAVRLVEPAPGVEEAGRERA